MPETCWSCETGGRPRLVYKTDDVPLCQRHFNSWIARYLNADDEPPCSVHLILSDHPEADALLPAADPEHHAERYDPDVIPDHTDGSE